MTLGRDVGPRFASLISIAYRQIGRTGVGGESGFLGGFLFLL
jgi:hypothetical protein